MLDMRTTPSAPRGALHWTALAITVFVIGLLILVPSGLCTGIFGIGMAVDAFNGDGFDSGILVEILLIGGIPMAIGYGLVRAGLSLRKRD